MLQEPLEPGEAQRLIRENLRQGGRLTYSPHAFEEMDQDGLTMVDCANVLRAGMVAAPELRKGTWRYRVQTNRICVVVAFRSEDELRIVTAWRVDK
jgi:hypothetical protein